MIALGGFLNRARGFQEGKPTLPFQRQWYQHGNHISNKVCDKITYPFPNFNGCINYYQNDLTRNCISSKTHNWYMDIPWEIETPNLGIPQTASLGELGGYDILFISAPICISVKQPLVSLSLFNGTIQWLIGAGWEGQRYLTTPIWKCRSGIEDHRFTILMDFIPNYTFYTNLKIVSIG